MPNFRTAEKALLVAADPYFVVDGWTKLPYPESWAELEAGVSSWLDQAWGPEWRCPHCRNGFWGLLEAVRLQSAPWPIEDTSSYGSYPAIPVFCTRCRTIFPVVLFAIFDKPPDDADDAGQGEP